MPQLDSLPGDIELRAEYVVDRRFLERAMEMWIRKRKFGLRAQVVLVISGVLSGLLIASAFHEELPIGGPLVGVGIFAACASLASRVPARSARATVKNMKPEASAGVIGGRRVEVGKSAISFSTAVSHHTYALKSFEEIYTFPDMLLLFLPGSFVAIPHDADFGRDTFDSFAEKLFAMIESAKSN